MIVGDRLRRAGVVVREKRKRVGEAVLPPCPRLSLGAASTRVVLPRKGGRGQSIGQVMRWEGRMVSADWLGAAPKF